MAITSPAKKRQKENVHEENKGDDGKVVSYKIKNSRYLEIIKKYYKEEIKNGTESITNDEEGRTSNVSSIEIILTTKKKNEKKKSK